MELNDSNLNQHVFMSNEDLHTVKATKVSNNLEIGDSVFVVCDDLKWNGVVVGLITKLNGEPRVVVSHEALEGEILQIYKPHFLKKRAHTYDRKEYQEILRTGY